MAHIEPYLKQNVILRYLFLDTDRVVGKLWLPAAGDHGDQVGPVEHLGNHQAAHLGSSLKNQCITSLAKRWNILSSVRCEVFLPPGPRCSVPSLLLAPG